MPQIREELLLDVGRLHSVHERDRVFEEYLSHRVLLHEVLVLESVDVECRQFQKAEAEVERHVDDRLEIPHLDTQQMLIEDFEADAVWLLDNLHPLLLACSELEFGPPLLIFSCFPVYRVIRQVEELHFEVVLLRCAQRRILLDLPYQPARMLESKHLVNINQPHAVLELEAQLEVMRQEVAVGKQVCNELRLLGCSSHFLVFA